MGFRIRFSFQNLTIHKSEDSAKFNNKGSNIKGDFICKLLMLLKAKNFNISEKICRRKLGVLCGSFLLITICKQEDCQWIRPGIKPTTSHPWGIH